MWQLGERLEANSWHQDCSRCGLPKRSDNNFPGRWIEHQVDDCIWSLKTIVLESQKELYEIKMTMKDLKERLGVLEMNPLDRLAREAP